MGVCMRESVCPGCSSMRPLFLLSYPPFFFQSESGPYNYRERARDQLVLTEAGRVAIAPELKTQPFPYVTVSFFSSVALCEIDECHPKQTKSVDVTFPAIP